MTDSTTDPRAVSEYRIPAPALKIGDLINTSPGEDDWQRVTGVYARGAMSGDSNELRDLIATIGDRYVAVEMTDIAPVDANLYVADETVMTFGTDDSEDAPVMDQINDAGEGRIYLYTVHELVRVRS